MRVAVAQVHPPTADPLAAVEKLRWLLGGLRAAAAAADLLVLPEAWLQSYHLPAPLAQRLAAPLPLAADAGGGPLERVAALAAEFGVAVALGFVERLECAGCSSAAPPCGAAFYNSLALIDGAGRLVACYRKTHLWGAAERALFSPGPAPQACRRQSSRSDAPPPAFAPVRLPAFPDTPIGLLVCYDLEFPEPSRLLTLAGAKLIVASTAMGEREAFASRVFARARAAENHVGVVFSNYPSAPPPPPASPELAAAVGAGPHYSGGSSVIGPDGSVIFASPAYLRPGADGRTNATQAGCAGDGFDAAATAATRAELARGGGFELGFDEGVFVVRFDADAPKFLADAARNPYLQERRADLYGPGGLGHVTI